MNIAIITITENGKNISRKIAENLDNCTRYSLKKYCTDEKPFTDLSLLISEIFNKYDALIFVCACGIVVRVTSPHISSKLTDPAVLAVDERGKFAVSLLSGHIGGANALTKKVAGIIGAKPVITTATDIGGKFSPDSFAKSNGLYICEPELAKEAAAAVVNGEKIGFYSDYEYVNLPDDFADGSDIGICVSADRTKEPFNKTLHLIPQNIVIGVGCKKNTNPRKLIEFVRKILGLHGILLIRVCAVNTIDIKKEEPAITALGKTLNVPISYYSAAELMEIDGEFSSSEFVLDTTGTDNVCERSAAVSGGRIIVTKQSENGMTAAVAEMPVMLDFERELI